MDNIDKNKMIEVCHNYVKSGHKYKNMAENPLYSDMFQIQNKKEYCLGMIFGSYIQLFEDHFIHKYNREMDEDERAFMVAIFIEMANEISSSLFK